MMQQIAAAEGREGRSTGVPEQGQCLLFSRCAIFSEKLYCLVCSNTLHYLYCSITLYYTVLYCKTILSVLFNYATLSVLFDYTILYSTRKTFLSVLFNYTTPYCSTTPYYIIPYCVYNH